MKLLLVVLLLLGVAAGREDPRVKMRRKLVQTIKSSAVWQKANQAYRAKRVARGLSPDLVPHEEYVRMRDGTLLWTLYWDGRLDPFKAAPAVLIRSPYSPAGTENMADLFVPFGFVAVEQNQRGTGDSAGDFCFWMTSRFDGKDTMDWISSQKWSNGQVMQAGASADGILSTMDVKIPQPALAAQWLMVTTSTPYDTLFQNGMAVREGLSKNWLSIMQAYRPHYPHGTYYETALRNEGFGSTYTPPGFDCGQSFSWPNITVSGTDFLNVNFPAVHTGGWYDIFAAPQLQNFENYDKNSSAGGRGAQQLFFGPRGHCFFEHSESFPNDRLSWLWSYQRSLDVFKAATTPDARASMPPSPSELYDGLVPQLKYTLYVMGPKAGFLPEVAAASVRGMYWTSVASLPVATPLTLFFGPDRRLQSAPATGEVSYVFDPRQPVPTVGGNNLFLQCGPQNQTAIDGRSDTVLFEHTFAADTTILGSVLVSLDVRTSANDTDFVVRLSDVYPGGATSMLLSDNIVRMRWRNSRVTESTTTPHTTYTIQLPMWELCYVFNANHTLRVAVTSSNYPRYSVNRNNGLLVYEGGPMINATNTIVFGSNSRIELPTVPLSELPPFKII